MLKVDSTPNHDFCKNLLRRKKDFSPTSTNFDAKSALDVRLNNNNNNVSSPGHCSSQDGSFIQDDDMRLILEFGGLLIDEKPSTGAVVKTAAFFPTAMAASSVTSSSLMSSPRRRRRQVERHAARFDADVVAHLDFDDFSASRDMAPLYDVNRYRVDDSVFGSAGDDLFSGSILADGPVEDKTTNNFRALAKSPRPFPVEAPPPSAAFISTDSLDSSACCMSMTEEHWQNFCAPNKREYVLTFDKQAFESGLAVFSTILDSYCSSNNEENLIFFQKKTSNLGAESLDANSITLNLDSGENRNAALKRNVHIEDKKLDFRDGLHLDTLHAERPTDLAPNTYPNNKKMDFVEVNDEGKLQVGHVDAVDISDVSINMLQKEGEALDENFNTKRAEILGDKNRIRLRNVSESNRVEPDKISDEKFTCFSEQNLKANGNNDDNSDAEGNTVTWQRIKRSYDQGSNFPPSSKCISLPNLKPFAKPDTNNTTEESTVTPQTTNLLPGGGSSLLKAFQQQQIKQQHQFLLGRKTSNQSESGYQTGAGSSNVGTFPTNQTSPIDTYTTAAQCKELLEMTLHRNDETASGGDFTEYYVSGKKVDVNHNEIGYVAPPEKRSDCRTPQNRPNDASFASGAFLAADPDFLITNKPLAPVKPPRTFRAFSLDPFNSPTKKLRSLLNRSAQTADDLTGSISIELPSKSVLDQSPDLSFLRFPFKLPPLNVGLTPFLRTFLKSGNGAAGVAAPVSSTDDFLPVSADGSLTDLDPPQLTSSDLKIDVGQPTSFDNRPPDANSGKGPDHVQDWDSLALLLPDNVVKCCRFFAERNVSDDNGSDGRLGAFRNTERPSRPKSINNRRRSFGSSLHCRYDGSHFEKIDETDDDGSGAVSDSPITVKNHRYCAVGRFVRHEPCCGLEPCGNQCTGHRVPVSFCPTQRCCHSTVQNLAPDDSDPFRYETSIPHNKRRFTALRVSNLTECKIFQKKMESLTSLIQKIVSFCNRIDFVFRQSVLKTTDEHQQRCKVELGSLVFNSLCPAIEALIADSLSSGKSLCDLLKLSPVEDVATKSICGWLISGLGVSGGARERSLQFSIFIDSLLCSKSLAVWLSNLISDDRTLVTHYSKFAYLRLLATKTCVRLYESAFASLRLLARLPFDALQLIDMDLEAAQVVQRPAALSRRIVEFGSTNSIGRRSALDTPTDQSPPTSADKSRLKTPRVYCSASSASPTYCSRQSSSSSLNEQRLVMVQDELKIVFRFPPTTLLNDAVLFGKNPAVRKASTFKLSPAQLADDSRIPKNSSSVLRRLNSPKRATTRPAGDGGGGSSKAYCSSTTLTSKESVGSSSEKKSINVASSAPKIMLSTRRRTDGRKLVAHDDAIGPGTAATRHTVLSTLNRNLIAPASDERPNGGNASDELSSPDVKEKWPGSPVRSNSAPKSRIPLLSRMGLKANVKSDVPT